MPESSPAACRFAIRDKTAFCALLGGLLNIDSALTLISFAGRDDADGFFFVMFILQAITWTTNSTAPVAIPMACHRCSPATIAVLAEDCMGIVEHKGRALETEAVVFLFVDPVLFGVPFKPHRYTQCITVNVENQTGSRGRRTASQQASSGLLRWTILPIEIAKSAFSYNQ